MSYLLQMSQMTVRLALQTVKSVISTCIAGVSKQ
jgi:hypothetical protein